ncbi:cyclopropane-fatty-acyl-phospholipid synthase family protein [Alterisphingorhabdus coralli]|uniref:Cyclopropane-fatty-acyl-phospholipid synthase family protein n=1 Tax=Alterisphingorhabdus coralli TaxID=3071408 RepID=A0AA97F4D4_9SPHN|nr:cyclopropane-fatty-acyl-phospholipid synthase family protein [Parasphingorhabdus sp. SCSIO 66989]WOE73816.1 cyclopropane-fatty-acyl-phospholipid synthase family protein [Parasphingorhabdus sp. SCSIO 66989]
MNAPQQQFEPAGEGSDRGRHLTAADRSFVTGWGPFSGLIEGLIGKGLRKALDRIDAGLEAGSLEAHLPDGTHRVLGRRGEGPKAEIALTSWRALLRLGQSGSVGWYKAWELGEWHSPDPVPIFDLFTRNRVALGNAARASGLAHLANRIAHLFRSNSKSGAQKNIAFHYDLGNDFYAAWLDDSMTYSSALFAESIADTEPLEQAQQRKIQAISDRLQVGAGDKVWEIGCGWGALSRHIAAETRAQVTGITLSQQQLEAARVAASISADNDRLDYQLIDYRDVEGQFDAIASVEMVEAVGMEYWPAFLDQIVARLKPGGRAALQYITIADDIFEKYASSADFIQTYIFPGGHLLSENRFRALAEERGLIWTDQHNFGLHYAETLRRWRLRFDSAFAEGRLPSGFDKRFINLWRYYLMYCEGGFRGGGIDVAQVTLVKPG